MPENTLASKLDREWKEKEFIQSFLRHEYSERFLKLKQMTADLKTLRAMDPTAMRDSLIRDIETRLSDGSSVSLKMSNLENQVLILTNENDSLRKKIHSRGDNSDFQKFEHQIGHAQHDIVSSLKLLRGWRFIFKRSMIVARLIRAFDYLEVLKVEASHITLFGQVDRSDTITHLSQGEYDEQKY